MEENEIKDVKKKKGVKVYHIIIVFLVAIIALLGVHIYANNTGYGDIIGLVKGEKKAENSKKQEEETVSDYFILYKGYEIKKVAGVQDLSEMKITDEATKKYNIVYYNYQSRQYTGEKEGSFGEEIYEGVSKVQNVDKIAISEKYNAIPRDFTATDKLPDELKDMADYTHVELNSIDLDGDGTEEKIICYHLNYKSGEIGDGSPKASSGLILMDSNYKKIADLETLENGFWGGIKEEAQKKFIDISDVEYIDIDNDGKMEMIIDIPTYEGTKISIIKYDEGKIEGQTDIKASVDNGEVNSATTNNTEKNIAFSTGKYVVQGVNLSPDPENYGIESLELEDDNEFIANMPLGTRYVGLYSVEDNIITCTITGVKEEEGGSSLGNASGELVFKIVDKNNIVFEKTSDVKFNLTIGKTYTTSESKISTNNINYSELTQKLDGEDVLFVTHIDENSNNTITLYGVVYKGIPNAVQAQISTQWSKTNEYKKITLSRDTICITAYPEESEISLGDYFRKYEDIQPLDTTNPSDIATYTFEFQNGKCVKVIDTCTSI